MSNKSYDLNNVLQWVDEIMSNINRGNEGESIQEIENLSTILTPDKFTIPQSHLALGSLAGISFSNKYAEVQRKAALEALKKIQQKWIEYRVSTPLTDIQFNFVGLLNDGIEIADEYIRQMKSEGKNE